MKADLTKFNIGIIGETEPPAFDPNDNDLLLRLTFEGEENRHAVYIDATPVDDTEIGELAALIAKAPLLPEMAEALRMYLTLDNDRRAGCPIFASDWADCFQAASAALAKYDAQD